MAKKRVALREPMRPYTGANFLVDLGEGDPQSAENGFCEVVFPDFLVIDQQVRVPLASADDVSNGKDSINRNLILKRGFTGSRDLYTWWDKTRRARKPPTRTVSVTLLAADSVTAVVRWQFVNARPVRLTYSPLNAINAAVLIETIELEFESVEMSGAN